jgi:Flp pilus assembly protein TadG
MDAQERKAGPLRRALSRLRSTEKGQALVEFTMVLPLLLILLFAIVDFGRAFYAWTIVTNGAREGARAAAVQGSVNDVNTAITNATNGLQQGQITKSYTNIQGNRGETVSVTVNYAFTYATPLSPLLTLIGGSSLATPTISSTSQMRLE